MKYILIAILFCSCIGSMTLTDLETEEDRKVFYKKPTRHKEGDTIYLKSDWGTRYYKVVKIK